MSHRLLHLTPLLAGTLVLASCGADDSDPGPGGVSMEDARPLDKAAAKLDAEQANPEKPDAKAD